MSLNIGNRPLRIALGCGHANSSGGNQYELGKNRAVVQELLRMAGQSKGFEIRCWTPDNGKGMYPGPLDAAAAQVRTWVAQGWKPDFVHELHHEGLGNTSVRGGFVIYPDSVGLTGRKATGHDNVDIDVRDHGGQMASIIAKELGTVIRGNGTMSERSTGVGIDGWRLGFFGAVSDEYFVNNACVFITEALTYTNPTERAIMDRSDFAHNEAFGVLKAYAYLAKAIGSWSYKYEIVGDTSPTPAPSPVPPKEDDVNYPDGMDEGIAAMLFGGANGYTFAPIGIVSTAWMDRGKKTGTFPRLIDVREFDTRRYFVFSDGWTLLYNTKGGTLEPLAA